MCLFIYNFLIKNINIDINNLLINKFFIKLITKFDFISFIGN